MINPGPWVLGVIRDGYSIEFTSPPPLFNLNNETPVPTDPEQRSALEAEISTLLQKKAIRQVDANDTNPLFRSRFFLAPKKQGSWRPILNLRPLNKRFIRPKRFRMETLATIIPLLRENMWATSVDLQDAYLHVPVREDDRRYLAFRYRNVDYQFQTLPFGLSTAPRVFTRVTRTVLAFLRRSGMSVFAYLDDWLIVSNSKESSVRDTRRTVFLLESLGWIVNMQKSSLSPSQTIVYLL